jgi:hypothetical protein
VRSLCRPESCVRDFSHEFATSATARLHPRRSDQLADPLIVAQRAKPSSHGTLISVTSGSRRATVRRSRVKARSRSPMRPLAYSTPPSHWCAVASSGGSRAKVVLRVGQGRVELEGSERVRLGERHQRVGRPAAARPLIRGCGCEECATIAARLARAETEKGRRRRPFFPADLRRAECYCTAFIMSKIGRYMATTMPPTTTPRITIMIGSMSERSALTATSTSSS